MQALDLQYREITKADIPEIGRWLIGWNKTPIEEGMYPETGLILYDTLSSNSIYAGFVWCSNSKLAQIGFVTRNPFFKTKIPKGVRKEFLLELMRYAKSIGYDYVITWAQDKGLVKDFKEIGLQETSDKCSELIAKII